MKKNLLLIVAFGLPILMIIFVIALFYLPTTVINPSYNFLYATGVDYYWPSQYVVKNNHLIQQEAPPINPSAARNNEQLYLYDVKTAESTKVDYTFAKKLLLDSSPASPDGFHISHASSDNSFFSLFFFSNPNYNTRFLQKGSYSKRLNLKLVGQFYNSFYFIGWVLDGKTNTTR